MSIYRAGERPGDDLSGQIKASSSLWGDWRFGSASKAAPPEKKGVVASATVPSDGRSRGPFEKPFHTRGFAHGGACLRDSDTSPVRAHGTELGHAAQSVPAFAAVTDEDTPEGPPSMVLTSATSASPATTARQPAGRVSASRDEAYFQQHHQRPFWGQERLNAGEVESHMHAGGSESPHPPPDSETAVARAGLRRVAAAGPGTHGNTARRPSAKELGHTVARRESASHVEVRSVLPCSPTKCRDTCGPAASYYFARAWPETDTPSSTETSSPSGDVRVASALGPTPTGSVVEESDGDGDDDADGMESDASMSSSSVGEEEEEVVDAWSHAAPPVKLQRTTPSILHLAPMVHRDQRVASATALASGVGGPPFVSPPLCRSFAPPVTWPVPTGGDPLPAGEDGVPGYAARGVRYTAADVNSPERRRRKRSRDPVSDVESPERTPSTDAADADAWSEGAEEPLVELVYDDEHATTQEALRGSHVVVLLDPAAIGADAGAAPTSLAMAPNVHFGTALRHDICSALDRAISPELDRSPVASISTPTSQSSI